MTDGRPNTGPRLTSARKEQAAHYRWEDAGHVPRMCSCKISGFTIAEHDLDFHSRWVDLYDVQGMQEDLNS